MAINRRVFADSPCSSFLPYFGLGNFIQISFLTHTHIPRGCCVPRVGFSELIKIIFIFVSFFWEGFCLYFAWQRGAEGLPQSVAVIKTTLFKVTNVFAPGTKKGLPVWVKGRSRCLLLVSWPTRQIGVYYSLRQSRLSRWHPATDTQTENEAQEGTKMGPRRDQEGTKKKPVCEPFSCARFLWRDKVPLWLGKKSKND